MFYRFLFFLLLSSLAILLDQWSKLEILKFFIGKEISEVEITNLFNLVLVHNQGISFGILANHNQPVILIFISVVISLILFIWLFRTKEKIVIFATPLIIGGAIGNVIDRVKYGAVIDFLDFHIGNLHWPAFNFADSFVFIGVCLLLISSFFEGKNCEKI